MLEHVILVDEEDKDIGNMDKAEVHQKGILHRAFSIFIFNNKNEFLLQQRAMDKYHSPGLWTNTCCSHPRPGESSELAAIRRLKEEMGIECKLTELFSFIYKADVGNGLIEHELDHVFTGQFDGSPMMNTNEVMSWKFISKEEIIKEYNSNPDKFTVWFKIAFDKIFSKNFAIQYT